MTYKKLFKSLKGVHQLELKGIETKLKEALDLQILMDRRQAGGGGWGGEDQLQMLFLWKSKDNSGDDTERQIIIPGEQQWALQNWQRVSGWMLKVP